MVHEITIKRLLEGQFCECNLKRNKIRMGEPVIRRSNPHKWPLTRPPTVNLTAIETHNFRGELMRTLDTTHQRKQRCQEPFIWRKQRCQERMALSTVIYGIFASAATVA